MMVEAALDTQPSPVIVSARNIDKYYTAAVGERVWALRGVSLEVKRGEFVSLIGRSGSGKTSFLHIMGTLELPDAGTLEILGVAMTKRPAEERLAAVRSWALGFVFQNFCLFDDLTAIENIAAGLLYRGAARRTSAQLASEALERVGLSHRSSHFPRELSGGERQRVAIARAIVGDRALVLADEPTGNLDSVTAGEVWRTLRTVADGGVAVVVATHDLMSARIGDRTLTLRDGAVVNSTIE